MSPNPLITPSWRPAAARSCVANPATPGRRRGRTILSVSLAVAFVVGAVDLGDEGHGVGDFERGGDAVVEAEDAGDVVGVGCGTFNGAGKPAAIGHHGDDRRHLSGGDVAVKSKSIQ